MITIKTCENCKYHKKSSKHRPCLKCGIDGDYWIAREGVAELIGELARKDAEIADLRERAMVRRDVENGLAAEIARLKAEVKDQRGKRHQEVHELISENARLAGNYQWVRVALERCRECKKPVDMAQMCSDALEGKS